MNYLKTKPYRSESYRRFVASFPCFGCGIEGWSQCAHANHGKGLGMKVSDLDTFPLCSVRSGHMGYHQMHDLCLDMTRGQRRELEAKYVDRMHRISREHGRAEFKEAA